MRCRRPGSGRRYKDVLSLIHTLRGKQKKTEGAKEVNFSEEAVATIAWDDAWEEAARQLEPSPEESEHFVGFVTPPSQQKKKMYDSGGKSPYPDEYKEPFVCRKMLFFQSCNEGSSCKFSHVKADLEDAAKWYCKKLEDRSGARGTPKTILSKPKSVSSVARKGDPGLPDEEDEHLHEED